MGWTCTMYLLTQWAAVTATWGWMSEAPHRNKLICMPPSSVSSSLSRASIHGNSPNCVTLSSLNIRSPVRPPPLTPHEPGGGGSVRSGDGRSLAGVVSPWRTSQHTCTPGHRLSIPNLCTQTTFVHTSVRYLEEAMVWSQYRGGGTTPLTLN